MLAAEAFEEQNFPKTAATMRTAIKQVQALVARVDGDCNRFTTMTADPDSMQVTLCEALECRLSQEQAFSEELNAKEEEWHQRAILAEERLRIAERDLETMRNAYESMYDATVELANK